MKKTDSIDCFKCRHFFVTWDQNAPRGCRAFGFKTRRLPSEVVLETSGEPCLKFQPKHPPDDDASTGKRDGWVA
ncbi:uracil-DNA glycosylase [Thiomicrorhabdus sp.]|uniref:uracil-DNA glycosylase n=1 Tax=Thiomicrorhabdus sp. TaxID=2039724 RepID=UPI0029C7E7A2|nr:uracil-DNA glycosylase [Thiomicrorhabdus sp.]